MKLNELFNLFNSGCDFDTSDNIYDAVVTWIWNPYDELDDDYPNFAKFTKLLAEKIDVVKIIGSRNPVIVAGYSDFIDRNFDLFKEFALENWREECICDDEDMVYEFIGQFHLLLAGNGTEKDYKKHYDLLMKCK